MFILSDRKKRIRSLFLVLFVGLAVVAGFVLSKTKEMDTIAATEVTANGAKVVLTRINQDVNYSKLHTVRFNITTHGQTYLGFCRNPSKRGPDADSNSEKDNLHASEDFQDSPAPLTESKRNTIKMMAYLASTSDTVGVAAYNNLFNGAKSYYTSNLYNLDDADVRYGFSHAVISWVTDSSDHFELDSRDYAFVEHLAQDVEALVTSDSNAWVIARNYQLYGLQDYPRPMTAPELEAEIWTDMTAYQDIVWVEGPIVGDLKIQKCRKDTGNTCNSPLAGTNFGGIKFELYNNTGHSIYYDEQVYANGAKIGDTITLASTGTERTISNLPVGNYKVKEVSGNQWYSIDATSERSGTVNEESTVTVRFFNNVKIGSITVKKVDADTGLCGALGKASFVGTKFTLTGNGVEDTKELTGDEDDCSVTFDNLFYGSYSITETAVGEGYLLNDTIYNVIISEEDEEIEVTIPNQVKRGDVKFRKVDKNHPEDKIMANVPFRITSTTTGESHIVVTNSEGIVDTSANLHSFSTNGYDNYTDDQLKTIENKEYGTWFGGTTPNDSLGALPYDNYEITEVNCIRNMYCYDIETWHEQVQITSDKQVVDKHDLDNDCAVFSVETAAEDSEDHDQYIEAKPGVTIKDTVSYCAMKGKSFIIKGELIDKETGEAVLINGEAVRATKFITAPSDDNGCGQAELFFEFDASGLAGKEIVVYEKLYDGEKELAAHVDPDDPAQTIVVVSLDTTAEDKVDGDKYVEADENGVVVIKDTVDYCAKAGETYMLEGILVNKETGKPLDSVIFREEVTVPESGCGTKVMELTANVSELAGKEIVVSESLYEIGQTEQDKHLVVKHDDLDDDAQTVTVVSLDTTAMDNYDKDKFIEVSKTAEIRDKVDLCARAGKTYELKGFLMDKSTNELLGIDGGVVIQKVKLPNDNGCSQEIMTFTIDASEIAGKEIVVFEVLKEVGDDGAVVVEHSDINDDAQMVNVISLATVAVDDDDDDKYVNADKKNKIRDTVSYCVKAGEEFKIKGVLMNKTTGQKLIIDGKTFEQEVTIKPEKSCGTAVLEFPLDGTTFAGLDVVAFEYLYHDGRMILAHNFFEDFEQTTSVVSLYTYASSEKTGEKAIQADGEITIKDEIEYCFKANSEYVIKGKLMNKKTGKPIMVDGEAVEREIRIIPEEDTCGKSQLLYKFDASKLAGVDIVIFDEVYENGELIISHTDINNLDQTVKLVAPPDTGMFTMITGDGLVANGVRVSGLIGVGLVVFYLVRQHRKAKVVW